MSLWRGKNLTLLYDLQVNNSVRKTKSCKIFLLGRDCSLASLQACAWFEILLRLKNQLSLVRGNQFSVYCAWALFQSSVFLDISILWQRKLCLRETSFSEQPVFSVGRQLHIWCQWVFRKIHKRFQTKCTKSMLKLCRSVICCKKNAEHELKKS